MCSGFKCVVQHYCVPINELFTKMSSDFVIVLLWIIIISAFYRHHPNVTRTFRHIHVNTDS